MRYEKMLIPLQLSTGRSISTSASHFQPVTSLACDVNANFVLSGSADSNIHVWSLPNTTSFFLSHSNELGGSVALTPHHTFSDHRSQITHLTLGHSNYKSNIAISASRDNTALVWEYRTGALLRSILLPATPLCLTLDPADRALFVGYEDGTLQSIDFFPALPPGNSLHEPGLQPNPLQPKDSDRWVSPITDVGGTNCIALTYDSMTLLSAHVNGKILSWDIAKQKYVSEVLELSSSVTNLAILPPLGFFNRTGQPKTTLHNVVKARYDHMLSGGTNQAGYTIPANYIFNTHFSSRIPMPDLSAASPQPQPILDTSFSASLYHTSFPDSVVTEGLSELSTWGKQTQSPGPSQTDNEDMLVLETSQDSDTVDLVKELSLLKEKVNEYEAERKRTWNHLIELNALNTKLTQRESQRRIKKRKRKEAKQVQEEKERGEWFKKNGMQLGDEDKEEEEEGGTAEAGDIDDEEGDESHESSSTDEMTESE
jgi:pre-rRNA-processing protein IPI3